MGRRGPVAKPDKVRYLEGNPSKRPSRGNAPQPAKGKLSCPSWLSPEAKREWRRIAPELTRLGILTTLDHAALAAYCSSFGLWRQAQEVLSSQGNVYVSNKGKLLPRPELAIVRDAAATMKTFAAELGLTPDSRDRMRLPPEDEEISTMEKLLREANCR